MTQTVFRQFTVLLTILSFCCAVSLAQETKTSEAEVSTHQDSENSGDEKAEDPLAEILAGHSYHGDAFNEGPRQKAYLMGGTGNVDFPVTTDSKEVQAFVNQGVGQLHGFWDLEAERSFRHAASLDENCAMVYWGAALATMGNRDRAKGFIEKAVKLKDKASKREQMYIDAVNKYLKDKPDKTKRALNYLKDLESIVLEYPDDLEAKAFVVHRVWHNAREGTPVASYISTNALLEDIFEKEPLHPAHHYSIHLWDYRKPEMALKAAARGGVAAPSIAHMWHMPGHIYSRLKRYEDAVYQQEASARVDHAHMMRDRVMPDQIHNFAHNNEWLIRNLIFIGRVDDAISLAKNMTQLPQHPKYNTLEKRNGSASYGRRRLLQVLREYQMWDQAFDLCQSSYLQVPDNAGEQLKTLRLLGCAAIMINKPETADATIAELKRLLAENKTNKAVLDSRSKLLQLLTAKSKTKSSDLAPVPRIDISDADAKKEIAENKKKSSTAKRIIGQIEKALLAMEGYQAIKEQDFETAHAKLLKATGEDVSWLGELEFLSGKTKEGLAKVKKQVDRRPSEVIPLARLVFLQNKNGNQDEAKATFEKLRDASSSMDLHVELFARLAPIAKQLSLEENWMKPIARNADTGFRPPLNSLGPFRWAPSDAPTWSLIDSNSETLSSSKFAGKPHVVIFYLGHGCLHCAEQLNAFGPKVPKFKEAGIDFVAISSDKTEDLAKSIENYNGVMPFTNLVADPDLNVFKKYRAFDDFENVPLHGTFLIDGNGMVRWQDISYEPFMDHEFLLKEAKRLLGQDAADRPIAKKNP